MDYDVLIIGSGFGGSVSALRLTEKGYNTGVLEAGRRFDESSLPKTSWRLRNYLWMPGLGFKGIQRIHVLFGTGGAGVMVLAGAGVGGGSLVYANTLYVPPEEFFANPQWANITDWKSELTPYYDQAKRMLGVVTNPTTTRADEIMREVADDMGVGDTYQLAPVAVFFNDPAGREVDDPYFGGAGPRRRGCVECGECMTGCRHGAKNMLIKNYLHLAEQAGATIHPNTQVSAVRPLPEGGYAVDTVEPGLIPRNRRTFTAGQVIFSAGTYGTQRLLHKLKASGTLPHLSERLGVLTRTNSEAILGATRPRDTSEPLYRGVAITSSIFPDPATHIQPVRYGKGSNLMGALRAPLIDGGGPPRWLKFLGAAVRHPAVAAQMLNQRKWSERGLVALVMQSKNNSITLFTRKSPVGWKLRARHGEGESSPTWIPIAHKAVRLMAGKLRGTASGSILDLFNIPASAHFIGGCTIGSSARTGVIDPYQRVYGHTGLHIIDGSAITANPGVNPSLTITAQAERAMAHWPNKGDEDLRPAPGEPYRRLAPIAPARPAVPENAPGALRLPIAEIKHSSPAANTPETLVDAPVHPKA